MKVADLFLDSRQEIVSTRGRARGSSRQFLDEARQVWPDLPIVVLVNEGSASAAEIIAGAMQDHDRAVVVGTPTFGKGLVQTLFTLGENVALKLTTARWYTPSGRTIQRVARNEEEQFELASRDTGAIDPEAQLAGSRDSAAADSVAPIFRTDAGRLVGRGGIVPDILMRPDSTTPGEQAFIEAVGSRSRSIGDVLTTYALDSSATGRSHRKTSRLRRRCDPKWSSGSAGRRRHLAGNDESVRAIARNRTSRTKLPVCIRTAGQFRRRAQDDRQVHTALELLRKARPRQALLGLATPAGTATPPSRN